MLPRPSHVLALLIGCAFPAMLAAQGASITPESGTASAAAQSSSSVNFSVQNTSTRAIEYELYCAVTGNVTGCTVDPTVTIAAGATATVSVGFTTGADGSGTVSLTATGGWPFSSIGYGEYHVTVGTGGFGVSVTSRETNPTSIEASMVQSFFFIVHNTGTVSDTYALTVSCTGPVTDCGVFGPTSITLAPGQHATVNVQLAATSQAGSARVTLTATGAATGSGYHDFSVYRLPRLTLAASQDRTSRSSCPTIGASPQGAVQCGDLLFAHAMPSYRSMNEARGLSLLYNSGTVSGLVTFGVDYVTYPGDSVAQSFMLVVSEGGTGIAYSFFDGAGWNYNQKQSHRMAVVVDLSTRSTGAYPLVIEVTQYRNGWVLPPDTIHTRALVVNRRQSAFGSGWWPSGVERLYPNQLGNSSAMLVLADGSALLYRRDGSVYRSPPGDYSTLSVVGSGHKRVLSDARTTVWYSSAGLVDSVTDNNPTRNKAAYHWTTGGPDGYRLDSIVDPVGKKIAIAYDGNGYAQTVTVPASNPVTLFRSTVNGRSRIDSIADPDQHKTKLTYSAADLILTTKTRGTFATSSYSWDTVTRTVKGTVGPGGYHVKSFRDSRIVAAVHPTLSDSGTTTTPAKTAPFTSAVKTKVTSRRFTPGTPTDDTARFVVDVFGAPTHVDPIVGGWTDIVRDTAGLPVWIETEIGAQVAQAWANGRMLWSARGIDTGGTKVRLDTTRYEYTADAFRNLAKVVPPEGDSVRFTYDAYGRREYRYDALDRQSKFVYYANGQLKEIWEPAGTGSGLETTPTTYAYGTYGNLATISDGVGTTTYNYAANGSDLYEQVDAVSGITRYTYDDVKRPLTVTTIRGNATGLAYTPLTNDPTSSVIAYGYNDATGTRTQTDPLGHVSSDSVDVAGRVRKHCRPDGCEEYTFGDGLNVTQVRTRSGDLTVMDYDQFGRLTRKLFGAGLLWTTPEDTAHFGYDLSGNITLAVNKWSYVTRTYDSYGQLVAEEQGIKDWHTTAYTRVGAYHAYDRNGRRERTFLGNTVTMVRPECQGVPFMMPWDEESPCIRRYNMTSTDSLWYEYDAVGNLEKIGNTFWGAGGNTWTYTHDRKNRQTALSVPTSSGTSMNRSWTWNANDQLTGYTALSGVSETMQYDAMGRVISRNGNDRQYGFDGFGQLRVEGGYTTTTKSYHYDALGNRVQAEDWSYVYDPTSGRLNYRSQGGTGCQMNFLYDAKGNQTAEYASGNCDGDRKYMTYNLANQMDSMRVDKATCSSTCIFPRRFWYDALGRRIMMRSDSATTSQSTTDDGFWRYWWLDDHVAVKTLNWFNNQAPQDALFDDKKAFLQRDSSGTLKGMGEWFFYGPLTDQVLASVGFNTHRGAYLLPDTLTHLLFAQDYRGSVIRITDKAGTNLELSADGYAAFGAQGSGGNASTPGFNGHESAGGLTYMRNRWYDPNTGKFTQQDPIGFAGGINLYGYTGNDPITYSDPYGLCEDSTKTEEECGGVVKISAGLTLAVGWGFNVQAGVAIDKSTGNFQMFASSGPSTGIGGGLGMEVTSQSGTLRDFMGTSSGGAAANSSEVSLPVAPGANAILVMDAGALLGRPSGGIIGSGVSIGIGAGAQVNHTSGTLSGAVQTPSTSSSFGCAKARVGCE